MPLLPGTVAGVPDARSAVAPGAKDHARAAVARGEREAAILLHRGQVEGFGVIEPFLVAVSEDDDGTLEPISLREKIRASGLTFGTIAAEAVRYA